jgi:hypothetical protein
VIEPRVHTTLHPAAPDDELVTTGVGPHGDVLALWKSAAGTRITGHGSVIEIELAVEHPIVQPLPDGRVLVVGARCRWSPDGVAPNALVFDQAGQVVASAVFGDGIQHVATTPSGQTWVGYFDEGILGNLGWGDPELDPIPVPIGAHGLLRFDENLDLAWEFPFDTPFDEIEDCYALNVAGEVAWACYYADFPVVRVEAGQVAGWTTEAHGPDALVTDGHRCALVCYGGDFHVEVGELSSDGVFTVVQETGIALPDGPVSLTGRGDTLHIVAARTHYKVDLDQLMHPAVP